MLVFPLVAQAWQKIWASKNDKYVCGCYGQEKAQRGRIKLLMSIKFISGKILKLYCGTGWSTICGYLINPWIASLSWSAFCNVNCGSMKLFKTRSCTFPDCKEIKSEAFTNQVIILFLCVVFCFSFLFTFILLFPFYWK